MSYRTRPYLPKLFVLLWMALVATVSWSKQVSAAPEFVVLLAQTQRNVSPLKSLSLIEASGGSVIGEIAPLRVLKVKVPKLYADKIKRALERSGRFVYVERDHWARGASEFALAPKLNPNDPLYGNQWHHANISVPLAWNMTQGSSQVPMAIIDSGIDLDHPDLATKILPGWNFVFNTSNTQDLLGHGTAVAGAAGALGNNSVQVAGVNWHGPIVPMVVLDSNNWASYSNIASAIVKASDQGIRLINVSIGGSSPSSTLQNAANYAWNKGTLIFASAMNNGNSTPMYPAACDNVLAIGATDANNNLTSFSNYGSWVDFVAPGVNILTTQDGGGTGYWWGTSFASPVAMAVASLPLSLYPALSPEALVQLLKDTADDLGAPGFDNFYAHGKVNAYKAVLAAGQYAPPVDTQAPVANFSHPQEGQIVEGFVTVSGQATDNVGISRLELFLDGQLVQSYSGASFSYTWNTSQVLNGQHTWRLLAYDETNNMGQSEVHVTVNNILEMPDLEAPTVSIVTPKNGTKVPKSGVNVKVEAQDNVQVAEIVLYLNGVVLYQTNGNTLQYKLNQNKLRKGTNTLDARAWDSSGNIGLSASVVVYK